MVGVAGTQPPGALAPFGRFVVEARLGVGGMGEVFRARDGQQPIALKLMRPEIAADPRHRLMFVAEAQLAARLRHRNLVRLHDFGKSNGLLWMALELVDGLALDRLLKDGPLPAGVAAHVALELLDALAYVHGRGLVHRDVSAGNVLVSTAGEVKLADFGVAKLDAVSLTRTNEEKGKPSYMAPEQLREHAPPGPIDGRVDLFAVGVLLHRMTTGAAPFTDVAEWLRAGAPLAPAGPLGPVVARAMTPDRRARFADAATMAAAVQRAQTPDADAAAWLGERVRTTTAAATPMEDFDRLIIAALGGGMMAGGTRATSTAPRTPPRGTTLPSFADDPDEHAPTRQAKLSCEVLAAASEAFAEHLPTETRGAFDVLPATEPGATFATAPTTEPGAFASAPTTEPGAAFASAPATEPGAAFASAPATEPGAAFAPAPATERAPAFAFDDEDDLPTDGEGDWMFDYVPTRARDLAADEAATGEAFGPPQPPPAPRDESGVRVRPNDSISEAIRTSPVHVDAPLPLPPPPEPEAPIPVVTASVLLPRPPSRWPSWIIGGAAVLAAAGLVLTLLHAHAAPAPSAIAPVAPAAVAVARPTAARDPAPLAHPHRNDERPDARRHAKRR